jgi:hypothetical protein
MLTTAIAYLRPFSNVILKTPDFCPLILKNYISCALMVFMVINTTNILSVINAISGSTQQISTMINRVYAVVASISAVLIGLLWIPIAIGYFSTDENRKFEARTRTKNALIGTLIYIFAMSGALYAVLNYIITGA